MTNKKFIGIIIAAKYPYDLIGIKAEKPEERKANAVVLEVTSIAFAALLQVKFILLTKSFLMTLSLPDCLQASVNTNMSSAATPSTTKTTKFCKME